MAETGTLWETAGSQSEVVEHTETRLLRGPLMEMVIQ